MTDRPMLRSPHERDWEARRLADEGYGWEDIVVRLGTSQQLAKQIVIEQWHRRQRKAREGDQ